MPVYVKLGIAARGDSRARLETAAGASTQFTSGMPELAVPERLAEALDLWPELPDDAYSCEISTAGSPTFAHVCPRAANIEVLTEDRTQGPVTADVLILHQRRDALISDALAEELMIEIVRPRTGTWRFRGEQGRERPSAPPQPW